MAKTKKTYVTQPSLPDLEEFQKYLYQIWDSKHITNNGKFHKELEQSLADYLGVKYVSLFSNGTLALLSALQVLRIQGEVITTPYSFVATTHALHWNNIKPVFCDVDPVFGNLDPKKIESLITPKTTAILPVHVHGYPCDVEELKKIADTYGLKLIYDAAHAFDLKMNGQSILNFGDLSVLSFHATKVFNTIEGGAIISHDENTKKRIDYLKNFGFANETTVIAPGINAKMNELQAAFGLLQLKDFDLNQKKRESVYKKYIEGLSNVKNVRTISLIENVNHNFSYFPIYLEGKLETKRDELYLFLKENNIYARRYFYPLISEFPTYRGLNSSSIKNLPNAAKLSNSVICLPIFSDLDLEVVDQIIELISIFERRA